MVAIDFGTIVQILVLVLGMLIGWIANTWQYAKAKRILAAFGEMFNALNDALYDDKISEEEFDRMFEKAKGIWEAINS